jgi:hypothetical protein
MGENLALAYVDQRRDIIDPNVTLKETLTPAGGDQVMVRGVPRHVASYAKEFLFTAEQLRQPVTRSPAANAIASRSPSRSQSPRTCWCSTNRPTISTWIRSTRSKTCSRAMTAPC